MFRKKGCAEREELHPLVVDLLSEDLNLLQVSPSTWNPLQSESSFYIMELKCLLGKSPKFSGKTSDVCFCRLGSKLRSRSPGNAHYSPTRYLLKSSTSDRRVEEKTVEGETKQMTEKKSTNNNIMHPASRAETNAELNKSGSCKGQVFEKHVKGNTAAQNKNQSPDRKSPMPPKMDSSEKKMLGNAQNGEPKQGTPDKDAVEL